jgi:TetR/AcrR family transcriptional regulator, transcriptional repressor for nem operon
VDVRTGQGARRAGGGGGYGGASRGAALAPTASRVLDVAERLVQVRGYNGFSYADIAAELGITKASLHYHFATKADLGEALIARYATRFFDALDSADSDATSAPAKLSVYAKLYADVLRQQRMCLCGMLAAEYPTLPPPMQSAVLEFFDHNEAWLRAVLEQGRNEGSLEFAGPARDAARMIISGLEGALLVTRPYGDAGRFQVAADSLLASLAAHAGRPASASGQDQRRLPAR